MVEVKTSVTTLNTNELTEQARQSEHTQILERKVFFFKGIEAEEGLNPFLYHRNREVRNGHPFGRLEPRM